MTGLRIQLVIWLFEISSKIYTRIYKTNQPWNIKKVDLLAYPKDTLGYHLGLFLDKNNFELIPKVERHDCYHVLTGYSTSVEDEIALQYLCLGNGKHSPYLFGAVILGTIILPEHLAYYLESFQRGKRSRAFHNLDFKSQLNNNLNSLQQNLFWRTEENARPALKHPKLSNIG